MITFGYCTKLLIAGHSTKLVLLILKSQQTKSASINLE